MQRGHRGRRHLLRRRALRLDLEQPFMDGLGALPEALGKAFQLLRQLGALSFQPSEPERLSA